MLKKKCKNRKKNAKITKIAKKCENRKNCENRKIAKIAKSQNRKISKIAKFQKSQKLVPSPPPLLQNPPADAPLLLTLSLAHTHPSNDGSLCHPMVAQRLKTGRGLCSGDREKQATGCLGIEQQLESVRFLYLGG